MIPYRRQAADFIHASRRDYIESYVEALDYEAFSVFRGKKHTSFTIEPFIDNQKGGRAMLDPTVGDGAICRDRRPRRSAKYGKNTKGGETPPLRMRGDP